jgi:signal transduction histidine kinase
MRPQPALVVASLAAITATLVLALARAGVASARASGVAATPATAVPLLLAIGALCIVGLTIRTHRSAAWLAVIAAMAIDTVDLAAVARAVRPVADPETWAWLSIAICLCALGAVFAAAAYATSLDRRLGGWVLVVGAVAIGSVGLACLLVLADPDGALAGRVVAVDGNPLGALTLVTRTFLVTVVALVVLGVLGDLRPAARRARRRVAVRRAPAVTAGDRIGTALAWTRAMADELAPGRRRAQEAARAERTRLARELHAEVVPAVRRALAEAERDGSPERLAASLRNVLDEVDALVQSEHAIQLEVGGLIPALEWLAERVEDRSDIRVSLDVVDVADGDVPGGAPAPGAISAEPPPAVAVAVFRVARLALDNVVRHAPGSDARLEVATRADLVRLAVVDDGPGIDDGVRRSATAAGRRGLADMDAEAASCGASLVIERPDGGRGTRVRFDWPGI